MFCQNLLKSFTFQRLLLSCLIFTGCAHTRIAPRPIPIEALRLVDLAQKTVSIKVNCPVDEVVGHQYLLIFLPFGRISVAEIENHFKHALVTEVSQSGVAPFFVEQDKDADFIVRCETLSLTAYDLIFFRRIASNISLKLANKRFSNHEIPLAVEESEYRAFAFHAQLERVLQKLFLAAAQRIRREMIPL